MHKSSRGGSMRVDSPSDLNPTGEMIYSADVGMADTMLSVMHALGVESVTLTRRIFDRHGRRPLASITYTPVEFACKLGDGYDHAYEGKGGIIEERGV